MAANYFYPYGNGGSQFSMASGSYPGGYSGQLSSSTGQQPQQQQQQQQQQMYTEQNSQMYTEQNSQMYTEQNSQMFTDQNSQMSYNTFANQLQQQNSVYGENAAYYMTNQASTSVPSYTLSSTGADAQYSTDSYYQAGFQMQTMPQNPDNSAYLSGTVPNSLYMDTKTAEWHGAGAAAGPAMSHSFTAPDMARPTQSSTMTGFESASISKPATHYRNSAPGNQTWSNQSWSTSAPGGSRKPLPFGSRPRSRQPPKPSQLHYCEVCRISCAGPQAFTEHLEGWNHKKKAESTSTKVSAPDAGSGLRQLYCQLCDVSCTDADKYAAHVRGAKHQEVLNTHTKLGKPIPDVAASADGSEGVAAAATENKKVIVPLMQNFVARTQRSTAGSTDGTETAAEDIPSIFGRSTIEALDIEEDFQPVGLEYIEENYNAFGSVISFYCNLCDCNLTDPYAKLMHMKGRRHRINYEETGDPALGTNPMKAKRGRDEYWNQQLSCNQYRQEVEELRFEKECLQMQLSQAQPDWPAAPPFGLPVKLPPPPSVTASCNQALEMQNEQHVKAKHASIYPTKEDLEAVQSTVSDCEATLKFVSDLLASTSEKQKEEQNSEPQETSSAAEDKAEPKEEAPSSSPPATVAPVAPASAAPRELKAVVRVGALAKALLLSSDLNLELIVLCRNWPTRDLFDRIMTEFTKQLNVTAPDKYSVTPSAEGAGFVVTSISEPKITCVISLTSLSVTEGGSAGESEAGDERLSRGKCLESLAALRHAKWFQGKASNLISCVVLVRILKDICSRIPTWNPLSQWALEILAEKCLSSSEEPLRPGDGLRRVLECISSGLFLEDGPGLHDPCEKELTDVLRCLTSQQREDITVSAQHALRLLAFGQVHKILGMEPLSLPGSLDSRQRKRPRPTDCAEEERQGNGDSGAHPTE